MSVWEWALIIVVVIGYGYSEHKDRQKKREAEKLLRELKKETGDMKEALARWIGVAIGRFADARGYDLEVKVPEGRRPPVVEVKFQGKEVFRLVFGPPPGYDQENGRVDIDWSGAFESDCGTLPWSYDEFARPGMVLRILDGIDAHIRRARASS